MGDTSRQCCVDGWVNGLMSTRNKLLPARWEWHAMQQHTPQCLRAARGGSLRLSDAHRGKACKWPHLHASVADHDCMGQGGQGWPAAEVVACMCRHISTRAVSTGAQLPTSKLNEAPTHSACFKCKQSRRLTVGGRGVLIHQQGACPRLKSLLDVCCLHHKEGRCVQI